MNINKMMFQVSKDALDQHATDCLVVGAFEGQLSADAESLDKDEIEMLEDMILVAVNDASKKVDKETETKMGKYTQGMSGLF